MIMYLSIITILFIIYIEINLGNILFRINSKGYKSLNISSLFYYLINPFYNSFLWNIQLLDINYLFILIISIIFYLIF